MCVFAARTNLQRKANGREPIGIGTMYDTKDAPEGGNQES
ncbi:hypothetical protein BLA3211_06410 [Burkholderia aenigmatica]|uniref:Uncharacterized protein n=1 Tax=Burkholderia aenigmatica TaxID=2015348 RepID=A0A6J5JHS0_9BURK|nr:hypothetical protein BLA3211_06410 [Burkholderia aenigmatica]